MISIPEGATIYLNDVDIGQRSPALIRDPLRRGEQYTLRVDRHGYRPFRKRLFFNQSSAPNGIHEERVHLEALPGRIGLFTNPPGAQVFLNDMLLGLTPLSKEVDRISGDFEIRVELSGYQSVQEILRWREGELELTRSLTLKRSSRRGR
ncbi:MAG: PEGA domain-containing protein [Myxococcota bacterium]|nr:PEGA domain-containing protein [Myxococcota bacterium]